MASKSTATRADLRRFVDRYLGISPPPFLPQNIPAEHGGAAHFGPISEEFIASTYAPLLAFAESEFNHRIKELAQVASVTAPLPEFHFLNANAKTFQASVAELPDLPVIVLDMSLVTFWFMLMITRVHERYSAQNEAERRHLDDLAWSTISAVQGQRRIPSEDVPAFEALFKVDEQINLVATSMSRVFAYFVLLHELAHLRKEVQALDDGPARELAADAIALQDFDRLTRTRGLEWTNVPEGLRGMPLVYFDTLRAIEGERRSRGIQPGRATHPAPRVRRAQAVGMLENLSAGDVGVVTDMRLSLARLSARRWRR